MRPLLRSVGLLALALASGSAHALGLGQIQVKSGLGEPLLAEIPVISNDPSELVGLDAGLASPETFTRIGLEPPVGIVADLRFTVGSDTAGRPVIRITTVQPVTEPLLDFLVQVDWGQGRLVREYSASVGRPGSVEAQPAVAVEAPVVDAPAVVERPVVVDAAPAVPAPAAARVPAPEAPVPAPGVAPPAPAPVAASDANDVYRVRAGDTASGIAARVAPAGVSSEQTVVGLLRANPAAFIGGDPNQLRSGSVLRVPASAELQAIEAREAADLVRSYARQWRQARTQPQVAPVASAASAPALARAAAEPAGRLEIVPPGAGRKARGGTQSGVEAGGEGDMLRQELVQTKESLAARDAEVQELKSRVAELEKLQTDQQKLIAMQNSQLHAAQQRQAATPSQPQPAAPAPASHTSPLPWIAGAALVLLGLLAAAWSRRRARREPVFRAPPDSPRPARASIADAFPSAAVPQPVPATPAPVAPTDGGAAVPSWERAPARSPNRARDTGATVVASSPVAAPAAAMPASAAPLKPAASPTLFSAVHAPAPSREPGGVLAPRADVDATASAAPVADALPAPDTGTNAANVERLELAQAYLDLGDAGNARRLLAEVAQTGDATARGVAEKMLRDMG